MKIWDSGIFIALADAADPYHKRASELVKGENIMMIDAVFQETLMFAYRKMGFETALKLAQVMSEQGEIADLGKPERMKAIELMEKHKQLSFTDALQVVYLEQFKIREITSFDSDFNLIPEIKRIY